MMQGFVPWGMNSTGEAVGEIGGPMIVRRNDCLNP